jgi:hypothetical protein
MARPRAIRAVLGAASRLDAQKRTELYLGLGVVLQVNRARLVEEREERSVIEVADVGR